MIKGCLTLSFLFITIFTFAQRDTIVNGSKSNTINNWSAHYQFTAVSQSHASFKASYSGVNSLYNGIERSLLTITSTAFIGKKLWQYGSAYANPEISGGQGLSGAHGIAGFTNGESFRIGDPQPALYMARYYIVQHFPLSNNRYDTLEEDANQVFEVIPTSRITLRAGKFGLSDFFDNNAYSHDARTQFLNWSLMSNAAWDYPANTKGYTIGIVADVVTPLLTTRIGFTQVPQIANGAWLNKKIGNVNGATLEIEKPFHIGNNTAKLRLLGFRNRVNAPFYKVAIKELSSGDSSAYAVITGNAYNNKYLTIKYGGAINWEMDISNNVGYFIKGSYNDGKSATWAFTEIDQSINTGFHVKGAAWKRPNDVFGLAAALNGISKDHRQYLKEGGYGFIIGDGTLRYGSEKTIEAYYNAELFSHFYFTADYQFVTHPAYNKDRGPVSVFSLRGHILF